MNDKMNQGNPGFEQTTGEPGKDKRWFVFNLTDGIAAHRFPMTLEEAVDFMKAFPKAFEVQGYYKTSLWERIPPEQVQLVLLPDGCTPRLSDLLGELLEECKKRRGRQSEAP